jgi:hypothetical protein
MCDIGGRQRLTETETDSTVTDLLHGITGFAHYCRGRLLDVLELSAEIFAVPRRAEVPGKLVDLDHCQA